VPRGFSLREKMIKKKEEEWVLVSAGFRERKGFLNENPRTLEQILTAEKEAAERKRLAEEKAAEEKWQADAAVEAEFQKRMQASGEEFYSK
jgi:hypothetical protein